MPDAPAPAAPTIFRGLENVVVAQSAKSKVYGEEGRLVYSGYEIQDLAGRTSFEEIVHLLWYGTLPDQAQLDGLKAELAAVRAIPRAVLDHLGGLPDDTVPMAALRTGVSLLGCYDPDAEVEDMAARRRIAVRLVAQIPTLIAAFERMRQSCDPVAPREDLGHTANFLHMLNGSAPTETATQAVDTYLVLLADHGFNASTFSARVTASTLADMYSAITTALGTLKGPLHGGANQRVMQMLESIGNPAEAPAWVLGQIEQGQRIMGIGHRVYKTTDPRATILRKMSEALATETDSHYHDIAIAVADTAVEYFETNRPDLKLYPNVDFYSAAVLHAAGVPTDQFTPLFAMSRVAGWTAHALEQYADNRLIRPRADYVGPQGRQWVAIGER
jgi:citrate synthase